MPPARRVPQPRWRRPAERAAVYTRTLRARRGPRAPRDRSAASQTRKVCQSTSLTRTRAWGSRVRGAPSARARVRLRRPIAPVAQGPVRPRTRKPVYVALAVQMCVGSGGLTLLAVGARSAGLSDPGLVGWELESCVERETVDRGRRGASVAPLDGRERKRISPPRAASRSRALGRRRALTPIVRTSSAQRHGDVSHPREKREQSRRCRHPARRPVELFGGGRGGNQHSETAAH